MYKEFLRIICEKFNITAATILHIDAGNFFLIIKIKIILKEGLKFEY